MIKNYFLLILVLFSITLNVNSQVTIGSGIAPDDNALLDLKEKLDGSSNKGVILPRVSLVSLDQPDPMSEFINGMVVYNIANSNDSVHFIETGLYISDGFRWIWLEPLEDVIFPTEPWRISGTSQQATQNTENIYQNAQVSIGRSGAADPSAQLDVSSSNKGMLVPRMTTAQRAAIQNPTESLFIWNIDDGCFNFWKNNKWRLLCGDLNESTVKITPIDCNAATVYGNYKVGDAVDNTNYITVALQVIVPGSYIIEGNTGEGFFFQQSGSFPATGNYTIQMPCVGTPLKNGNITFPLVINGESSGCQKTITVEDTDAAFSFVCTNNTADALYKGESSTGKEMKINVDVTSAGSFDFYSTTVYDVQYTAYNVDLAVGQQEVTLYANGAAPTESGQNISYSVSGTGMQGAPCSVLVNILENEATLSINCGTISVNGVYKKNTATTTSNYIDVPVNFTSIGTWTASTGTVSGLSFSGSGSTSTTGLKIIRLYASGTPTAAGEIILPLTMNGVNCLVSVDVVFPTRNILMIGNVSTVISSALQNTSNFGEQGTSRIEGFNIITGASNPSASALMSLINDNNIHIIIAGWKFNASDAAAGVIADFVKNKKGYFFWAQSQGMQTYLSLVLDKTFGGNVSFTSDKYPLRATIFPDTDVPYLNGPFGDVRNKYLVSDDTSSWIGATTDSQLTGINWFVELPYVSNSYPARYTFLYGQGFFMFPDWGMLGKTGSYYGNNSPISFNTSATGNTDVWNGNALVKQVVPVGQVANWVLFGNVMDVAFKYVQENINESYVVTGAY